MPDSPFFPSLDLELQNLHALTPGVELPNNDFQGKLNTLNSLYQQIAAYKSLSPLLKKGAGTAMSGQSADPFPSLSSWKKTPLSVNDVSPVAFDPKAENLDRYKGSDLYGNIGFIPGRDNEELYGRQQTTWDKLTNGIVGSFELAKFQFVDQIKGWGRMMDTIASTDLSRIYDDNDMAMVSQKMDQIMNENPIFMTEKDRNSVFTASNFANIIQQSGFTLGAFAEIISEEILLTAATAMTFGGTAPLQALRSGMMVKTLGNVFRRMGQIENIVADTNAMRKVFNTLVKMAPMSETATLLLKGARGGETSLQLARRGFGAFYRDIREMNASFTEARAETSGTYSHLKDELLNELYAGNQEVTKEKLAAIETTAREAADANFWSNAAIISISNRIQFDNVFRGFKGASRLLGESGEIISDKAGFFKRSTLPFTKNFIRTAKAELPYAPLKYFKNNITEALQENLQNISNNAISAYYKANYNSPGAGNLKKSINDAISGEFSTEGARTFVSGFLTAAITSPVSRGITALGKRVSTTQAQRQQAQKQTSDAINTLNGFFSQAHGRNAGIQTSLSQAMGEAIKSGDIKGFQDIKDESVRQLVRTAMETGQIDAIFDKLDHFASNFTKEEFEKAFGIEFSQDNKKTAQDYITSLRGRTHQIKGIKEEMDYKLPNPFDPSKAEKEEDKIKLAMNHVAFENAKWQYLFMQDSQMRTHERQASILRDLQQDMSEVSYSALFPLTDEKRVRAEIKILREEAKVTNDEKLKQQKSKRADLLQAMLPGVRKGELHGETFKEYIDHIQEENKSLPVSLDKIVDNLSRFNDFFALDKDQKALFSNTNWLVDPENWANFVNQHATYMEAENWFKDNKEQIDEKLLSPVRSQFPDLDITMDDQMEIQVKDKEGKEVDEATKAAVVKSFQDEIDRKQKQKEEQEASDQKIKNRLAEIYQNLTTNGILDAQDRGFVELVKDSHSDDPNYIKIRQFLDTVPPNPAENQPPKPPAGPKAEEQPPKAEEEEEDDDAAPYYEGSENLEVDIPGVQGNVLKTIIEELKDKGTNRTPEGDVEMEGGYSWLKGTLMRHIATHPEMFGNVEFVLQQDRKEFYEHEEGLSAENKELLGVNHPKSPYSVWKTKSWDAVVLFLKDKRTGEFIYINPLIPGMFTDAKNGVVAMFPLDLKKAGLTPQQFISYVNAQPNGQVRFSIDQVAVSLGAYKENPGKLKSVRLFMEGLDPEERPTLHISKAPKGKELEWNDPENTRNGGAFLEVHPNLNRIKLIPAPLKDLRLSDGSVVDLKALFDMELTDKEIQKVLPFVKTIIYQGNFRPPKAYTEQIVVSTELNTKTGKVKLKLTRRVDTSGKLNEKAGERVNPIYKDSGQKTDVILDYLLRKRNMNVKLAKNQDITIPVIKEGKLSFVETTYQNFLFDNLYTNKSRVVHPDGHLAVHPIDNFLVLPEIKGMMETIKEERKKAQKVAAKAVGEKMSTLKEGEIIEEEVVTAKKQAELRVKILQLGIERTKEINSLTLEYVLPEGLSLKVLTKKDNKHVPGEVVLVNDSTKMEFTILEVRLSKGPKEIIDEINRIQDFVNVVNDKYEALMERAREEAFSKEEVQEVNGNLSAEQLAKMFQGKMDTSAIENSIKEVIENQEFITLSEDEKTYINTRTGKSYQRVTSYVEDRESSDSKLLRSSQAIGNKVDILVRDFFSGNLQPVDHYSDLADAAEVTSFISQLQDIKAAMDSRGEIVLANNIVLYNDELGLAGTVDLLTFTPDGTIRIYDMKTMRGNNFATSYRGDKASKYDSTRYGDSKREKHQKQLSLYRILLNNTHGLKAQSLQVLPIELDYQAGEVSTKKLNLLPPVDLTPLDKVNEAEIKDPPAGSSQEDFSLLRRIKEHTQRALIGNEELQFILDRFGEEVLDRMAQTINSEAWGYWRNGVITLFEDTVAGVGYHEAWHHFSQMFLTKEQKRALYREARQRNAALQDASDKEVEEFLADDFRDFKEKGTIMGEAPQTRNLFQRILDFLRYLFTGNKRLEQYYNDLNAGEFRSYKPTINNAMWGRLNYGFVTEVNGRKVEVFDAARLAVAQGFFNTMLHQAFARKGENSLRSKNLSFASLMSLRGDKKRMSRAMEHVYLAMKTEISEYILDNQRSLNKNAAGLQLLQDMQLHFDDFFNFAMHKFQMQSNIEDVMDTSETEATAPVQEDGDEIGEEDEKAQMLLEQGESQASDKVIEVEDKGLLATLSKIVRNMVLTIPKGEAIMEDGVLTDVVPARNEYGLTEPCNYYKVVNILGEELAGLFDDDKILAKLHSAQLMQRLPETKFILEALPDFTKPNDFAMQTLSSIVRDFNRVYTQVSSLIQNREGKMSFIEMTKNTERQILAEWMDNFLKSDAVQVDEKSGNRYLRKDFVEQNIALTAPSGGKTLENYLLFLEKMGVTFSERTKQLAEFRRLLTFEFVHFYPSLEKRLQMGQNIENPMVDMMRGFRFKTIDEEGDEVMELAEGANSFIRELLRLESQNSDRIPNNMYKTAKGTNKYALMLPNRFNITMDALKRATSLSVLKTRPELSYLTDEENYYIKNSLAWRSLFDSKGNRRDNNLDFGDYNSFKIRVYDKTVDKQTTELTGREKIIMNMNSLLLEGVIDLMRTGSSQSSYFYRIYRWKHNYQMDTGNWETDINDTIKLPFSKEMYEKGRPRLNHTRALRGYFFNLLVDELCVMNLSQVPSSAFQERIRNFGVFESILSETIKTELKASTSGLGNPREIRKAAFAHIDQVMKDVNSYLDAQTKDFIEYAEENGVTAGFNGAPSTDLDSRIHEMGLGWRELSKMFVLNDFILNVEYSRLVTGVPQFYKDYHKRAQTQTSTGNTANNGPLVREYLASTHSYTMAAARGKAFNPNIHEFGTQTTQEDHASLSESTKKLWLEAGKLMGRLEEMKKVIEQYQDINVNDGQAHCSFDFYRRMRIQMGNWDPSDEIEYTKEVYKWRIRKGLFSSEQEKKQMEATLKTYSDKVYSTFPVVKFQYEGPLKHPGIMIPVLHKFAVAPIIPSVYQSTDLEDMEEWMSQKGIDYVTSISGSKNFNTDPLQLWADPKKRQGWSMSLEATPNILHSALLKEQIKTGRGFKIESTWGTQLRSLFLSNAFNEGKSTKEIEELFDNYLGGLDKLIEIERTSLFRELGIKEEGDTITITNTEEFVRTLQNQAEVRNLNSNIKRAIGYDPVTGGFTTPLEIVTNRQAIMDLIGGMIFRRIVSIKTNGDMLVQVSSTGTRRRTAEGQYEAELPFYEPIFKGGKFVGVKPAGCKVAFNKHFYPLLRLQHADGKRINTLERLNEMLKVESWTALHKKEITLLAYRIPTQEPNSMEFLQVMEFLPETFGACIIVPKEITQKAGSDFDVDKLNIFRPSYDRETGRVMAADKEEFYQKALNRMLKLVERDERYQKIFEQIFREEASEEEDELQFDVQLGKMSEEDRRTIKEFRDAKRNYKYFLTNQAVDKYIRALSRPDNFLQLITPNSTKTVKPLAESVALKAKRRGFSKKGVDNYTNTKIFEYTVNHIKYLQNVQGRNDLAMLALLNKMLQNIQQAGLLFNSKFTYTYTSPGKNPYTGEQEKQVITIKDMSTTPWLLTKAEREALNRDGKWSVSQSRDVKGRTKQQIVSELMNATVDIAKDPFYIGMGINNFNKGVAGILILQGVPIERISYFLQQPILEEYYHRMTVRPYYVAEPREGEEELPNHMKKAYIATNINAREMLGLKNRKELEQFIKNTQNGAKRAQFAKLDYEEIFKEENLLERVGTKKWNSPEQQVILAHFLAMQRLQKVYRMLQDLATTDTKKIATPLAAEAANLKKKDVINSGLFDEASMNRLLTKSYTSAFNMRNEIRDIMETVMPKGFSSRFVQMTAEKIKKSDIYGTRSQMLRLEKTLCNDFVTYIALTFGEYKGQPLREFVGEMISRKKGNTISSKLTRMQKSYKKLFKHFALAELLHTNNSTKQSLDNIELVRGLDNSSEMQDVFIQDFEKLVDFNTTMVPGANYSKESEMEIQEFFRDLAVVAFGQSGFNRSFFYMTDVLPLKVMEPLLKKALKKYKTIVATAEQEEKFIKEFLREFASNNPTLGLEGGFGKVNEEPQRGKYLKSKVLEKVQPKQQEEKPVERKQLPAPQIETPAPQELKNRGFLQIQPDNVEKIKAGTKVITNRLNQDLKDGYYLLPDQTKVVVKSLGKARVIDDKVIFDSGASRDKDAYAKAEGFLDWADFEQNNKFSKNFISGKQSRYIYSVIPIEKPQPKPEEVKQQEGLSEEEMDAIYEKGDKFFEKMSQELFDRIIDELKVEEDEAGYPTPEAIKNIYINKLYPDEEFKQEFEQFLIDSGLKKEYDFDPNQLNLFQEDTLSGVIKKDNGKLVIWMGFNILEEENQREPVRLTDEAIIVSPQTVSEKYTSLKNTGSTIQTVEDYYNYLVFKELTKMYMRTNPQESEQEFERRKSIDALQRLRHSKSPDAYSEVMLSIPAAFVNASSSKSYEEFSEQAKEMIAVFSKQNLNPTREELSALFERLQCL